MEVEIYTDGACSGNPGKGGWGFVIINKTEEKELFKCSGAEIQTTNNRMEMTAVIEALKKIKAQRSFFSEDVNLSIFTDSKYVQQGISSWIFNWKKNNWQTAAKKPVKNKDLWQELDKLSTELAPKWNWVKGHAGNRHNEECDRLAVNAISTL